MGFPKWTFVGLAAAASLLVSYTQRTSSKAYFARNFALFWVFEIFLFATYFVIIWPYYLSPLRKLPEPSGGHWLHGHGPHIFKEPPGVPMRNWVQQVPNEGLIRYRWFFNSERVLLCSPKALAEVLTTNNYAFQKPYSVTTSIGRVLGFGLLLLEGDEHKQERRKLMPAFAFRHIKDLYPVFWQKSSEAVRAMSALCVDKPNQTAEVEIGRWSSRTTLDIIGVAGMGRDFGAIKDEDNELAACYSRLFRPSRQSQILGFMGMLLPPWLLNAIPIRFNLDVNVAAARIRAECLDLIREKKRKLANKELLDVDILSVALESGGISDDRLVDHLMTFLAAGHETTASSLTWAIYLMCAYPEMQARLRKEVRDTLPSTMTDAGIESLDIDHMPYLNAVCSETLRYFSPVSLTPREAVNDTTILGHPVPAGSRVIVAPWAINYDPQLWGPDAHKFNPDRWLPRFEGDKNAGGGHATSNYALLTFLHGPRGCIGQQFARSEFACLLAAWVGRFEFTLQDESLMDEANLEIKSGITTKPAGGLHCRIRVIDDY